PAQKLAYLKGYLADDALTVVAGLDLVDGNYKIAFDLLKSRFGNQTVLKQELYAELTQLSHCADRSTDLRRFLEKVVTIRRQLIDLGEDPDHALTTQLVHAKLPARVVSELLSTHMGPWKMSDLIKQLETIVEKRETVDRHKNFAKLTGRDDRQTQKPAAKKPATETSA
uniref:Transposase n=1 Tax=Steinernema glaseri TaxID=37863 RepID=A0A1I7ZVI7_9BILA